MLLQEEVQQKLNQIHRHRNRFAFIPNILLILASTYFQSEKLLNDSTWLIAISLVVVGTALRLAIFEIFHEQWDRRHWGIMILSYLTYGLGALGWCAHFYAVYSHYGSLSSNASNTLLLLGGLIIVSSNSLLAHKPSYLLYATLMCFVPAGIYLFDVDHSASYVVTYVVLFYFFNLSQLFISAKQIRRSVEVEIFSEHEKSRLKRLINAVPGFVGILDKNLIYLDVNNSLAQVFPNIIGQKAGFSETDSEYFRFIETFFHSSKDFEVKELRTKIHNEMRWILVSIQRTEDEGVIVVVIPMDELVAAKEELRAQEAKAYYSAKLASLGEMAAGIAHEVNNPLTIIQGSAQILEKIIEKEELDRLNIKILVNKIVTTIERISKTIKSLKTLSRDGGNDAFEEISLEEMINQCLEICRHRFNQNEAELIMPDFENEVIFQGREVQLSQVLMNLLNNALDAIRWESVRWVEIKYMVTQESLDILVVDSGPGVPVDIRSKIMEPFFTTKEVNQGTGLGLSISKAIMTSHGGELSLLAEGPHTTFRMRLPLVQSGV